LSKLDDTDAYNTKASADKNAHSTDKATYNTAVTTTKTAEAAVTKDVANKAAVATTSKGKAYAALVKTHTDAVSAEAKAKAAMTLSGQYDTQNTDFADVIANRLVWSKKDLTNLTTDAKANMATKKEATDL